MPRLSGALGRRIDRLSSWAHRFHRFAHHPLCAEYASELIPLGRRARICRGCTFTLLGLATGLATSVWVPTSPALIAGLLGGSLAWLGSTMLARRSPWLSTLTRQGKLVTRLAPAAAFGCGVGGALRWGLTGFAVLATASACLAMVIGRYRSRGPHRGPCETCPERYQASPCRGFAPIVRRERAFQRLASRWMNRAGV